MTLSKWIAAYHDDVIKWKHFTRYWPFVRGIHRSPVNFPHKGQWRGAFMYSLISLNGRLGKQSGGWWFETPSRLLWRHSNDDFFSSNLNCHGKIISVMGPGPPFIPGLIEIPQISGKLSREQFWLVAATEWTEKGLKHAEVDTKWTPFCRWRFQIRFFVWKLWYFVSYFFKIVPRGSINNKPASVLIIYLGTEQAISHYSNQC